MNDDSSHQISNLEELLKSAAQSAAAPVETWNPPYCGDIGLAIAADGSWRYRGSPIQRPALVKLFARVLRRDADGRHFLVTPAEKVDVHVTDAPFLAVEMDARGDGPAQMLTFRTNVDDVVAVDASHPLRFALEAGTHGLKPYILVRGRLEARLTRALTMDLVALAGPGTDGRLGVWSGGTWFAVEPA